MFIVLLSLGISSSFLDWNFKADLLSAVKLRDGHIEIPRSHVEAGVALGEWLHRQVGRSVDSLKKNVFNHVQAMIPLLAKFQTL